MGSYSSTVEAEAEVHRKVHTHTLPEPVVVAVVAHTGHALPEVGLA